MTTPSGQIAFSQVNAELGVSPTSTQANIGSAPFRGLAGVPSGQISMSNLQGKSSFTVTGGNVSGLAPGNGYKYHTFTSPGTLTVTGSKSAEILLVGGGGAGAPANDSNGGGGGAGGLVYWSSIPLSTGSYTVTIGSGGPGGTNNGGPSVFGPGTPLHLVALGGGYGGKGAPSPYVGNNGGSGGGGGGYYGDPAGGSGTQTTDGTIPANSRTYGFGNPGGSTGGNTADGGGGAGAAGNSPLNTSGVGGPGRQYPAFTGPLIGVPALNPLSGYFAGGGGALHPVGLAGGLGGGGVGGASAPGTPGVTNSGGGGGGSYQPNAGFQSGGTGGPGICVIRYLA